MNDQKIENLLNLALESTPQEREESLVLDAGYDRAGRTWDLIVRFNGDILALEDESLEVTVFTGSMPLSPSRNPVFRSWRTAPKLNILKH